MKRRFLIILLCCFLASKLVIAQGLDSVIVLPKINPGSGVTNKSSTVFDQQGHFICSTPFSDSLSFEIGGSMETLYEENGRQVLYKLDNDFNPVWAKSYLGGEGIADISYVKTDSEGNIYCTGFLDGSADLDPSEGTAIIDFEPSLGSIFGSFIAKYSSEGEYLWSILLEEARIVDVGVFSDGSIVICGEQDGDVNFNPAGVPFVQEQIGIFNSMYVAKYNPDGNLDWVNGLDGSAGLFNLHVTSDDQIVFAGDLSTSTDIDPSENENTIDVIEETLFLSSWDSDGGFLWGERIAYGSSYFEVGELATDLEGNIWVSGLFSPSANFETSTSETTVISAVPGTFSDVYLGKFSASGELIWVGSFGSEFDEGLLQAMGFDDSNNIYLSYSTSGDIDVDPNSTSFIVEGGNSFQGDGLIIKLDDDGNYQGNNYFSSDNFDYPSWITSVNGSVYVESRFRLDNNSFPSNVDLSVPPDLTSVLFRLNDQPCGLFSLDVTEIQNGGCQELGFLEMQAQFGTPPYQYEWIDVLPEQENSISITNSNFYTLESTDGNNCFTSKTVYVEGEIVPTSDSEVDHNPNELTPGVVRSITLEAKTQSCTEQSGSMIFYIDPTIEIANSSPEPEFIQGDTLIWFYEGLIADFPFQVQLDLFTPTIVIPGNSFEASASILPDQPDTILVNNQTDFVLDVVGPYDPNDKTLSPIGECEPNYLSKDEVFQYRIRFQNTGNAPATNVLLVDTLDGFFDVESIEIIDHSHPVYLELEGENILKFHFENIFLPDSTSDLEGSQGFVRFFIRLDDSTPVFNRIDNFADIYFDFNSPIRTNTESFTTTDGSHVFEVPVLVDQGLISAPDNPEASYQWFFCNINQELNEIEEATNSFYVVQETGSYTVEMTLNGCTNQSECVLASPLSTQSLSENELLIYPNPSRETMTIELEQGNDMLIALIFNVQGRFVDEQIIKSGHPFNVGHLESGLYFVTVILKNRLMGRSRFIKE